MINVHHLAKNLLMAGACVIIGACSSDDMIEVKQEQSTEKSTIHTTKMQFIGNMVGYDQQSSKTRAATTSSWKDGDKIYITFYDGNTIVPGEAIYTSSGWVVTYDGDLTAGTNLKCETRYFVNATFSNASLVSLNANSEIYEDVNAKYAYKNGSLTVQATLSPKTGRIRFTGESGVKIYTTGISVYTTFSPANNTFSSSNAMITSTVASNGSTPYVYGTFSDKDRNIGLVGSDFAYTRTCTADVLRKGESGYMAIPSDVSHNNWRSGLYVKASDVELVMIPVDGHSAGFFLIGETEVTEALYNSVNGRSSFSNLPISSIRYNDVTSFIEKLNEETNLQFSLPTMEQWQYAAQGGKKSEGYTYSGSNTPDDVAWYSANSNYSKQKVKTKTPNELGIYDMSGNVGEFVSTMYNGSYPYILGGSYSLTSSDIKVTSSDQTYHHLKYKLGSTSDCSYTSPYCYGSAIGFRLILTCP